LPVLFIIFIYGQLIGDPEIKQEAAGEASGETYQVEHCELAVLDEVAPGDLEIVPEHNVSAGLSDRADDRNIYPRKCQNAIWLLIKGIYRSGMGTLYKTVH